MLATVVGQPAVARVLSLLYIVLPAYNEERGIALLLRRIDATLQPQSIAYRALVVDDGSRDNTAALVEDLATALPVELLRHGHNRGVGRALATGLTQAARLASPEDAIVTMEGDNGSDPGYIRLLIEQLDQGADIAIASPFAPGARFDVPPKRWLLSVGANTLLRLLVRLPGVRCYTGMYRAFRADLLQRAGQRQGDQIVTMDGFTGIAELNRIRMRLGLGVLAIDVKLCAAARDHSADMLALGFFAHESPVPGKRTPGERAARFGTSAGAENIAFGQASGSEAITAWWYSPGHHRNLLSGAARVGLGRAGHHWTQMFGG